MMDREDRRRFFVIESVFLEVVTPVFRQQLQNNFTKKGFSCLQDFLNDQPVVHTLFHLNHRYKWYCCVDRKNCNASQKLPLNNFQWNLLYTENPGPGEHHCHCKYTAKPVQLDDLDITLMGLILVNCFTLRPAEEQAVRSLRQYKNDYLSHNTNGRISEPKYNSLWSNLEYQVLKLDPTRQSDLDAMKNRPLDEQLNEQNYIQLSDLNERFEEFKVYLKETNTSVQGIRTDVHGISTSLQGIGLNVQGIIIDGSVQVVNTRLQCIDGAVQAVNTRLQCIERAIQGGNTTLQSIETAVQEGKTTLQGIETAVQKLLDYAEKRESRENPDIHRQHRKSYKLGQDIFYPHQQFTSGSCFHTPFGNAVITDDGHIAYIRWGCHSVKIYNIDGSPVGTIQLRGQPWDITVVNNSTVAITFGNCRCIDIWDINNKQMVKSIPLSLPCIGITTLSNKFVVGCEGRMLIIDPQTEKVEKIIDTDGYEPIKLCGSGDGVFYTDCNRYYLNHYSHSKNKICKKDLPSDVCGMTTLQDGSVYVICKDGSVQHVSSDGEKYTTSTTNGGTSPGCLTGINYNPVQKKLAITNGHAITVFNEYE